jgi:ubiquinol-cytochrome c reductase cytochrome b subunit
VRYLKENIFLNLFNKAFVDAPLPSNITYLWNLGSILGVCLGVQIITGLLLAMHYTPHIDYAFSSVEHIMRDVNNGWLIRYLHLNGASMFFVFVYMHIGRGIYFGSFYYPRNTLWNIGVIIFLVMMGVAFLGYVLPWGQMSFWGATVITNMLSAIPWIGKSFVEFVWGGFSVGNATLNRFFALHFFLPFILVGIVLGHMYALHVHGSNNYLGITSNLDKIPFHPYFVIKDVVGFLFFFLIFFSFVYYSPNSLGHPDNYIEANPLVTPTHIVPEWYFLPFYAILRSIPNKLGGVILMLGSILILLFMSIACKNSIMRSSIFRLYYQVFFIIFMLDVLCLGWLGGKEVVFPYTWAGIICTLIYFLFFLVTLLFIQFELVIIKGDKK